MFDTGSVLPLGSISPAPGVSPLRVPAGNRGGEDGERTSFADTVKSYLQDVARVEREADRQIRLLSEGGAVEPHAVMLAVEEANLAIDMLIEIRNRLLEAYQELTRTAV